MMKNNYKIYHETFGSAIQEVESFMDNNKIVSNDFMTHLFGSVGYGETFRYSFVIDSMKQKNTRKCVQMIVYRLDSGRYELTLYVA